jgi:hypothetical protein
MFVLFAERRAIMPAAQHTRRSYERYVVQLPCHLDFGDYLVPARISDISLGGVRVGVSSDAIFLIRGALKAIAVEGHPPLSVSTRWKSQTELGLSFATDYNALQSVQKILQDIEKGPV